MTDISFDILPPRYNKYIDGNDKAYASKHLIKDQLPTDLSAPTNADTTFADTGRNVNFLFQNLIPNLMVSLLRYATTTDRTGHKNAY